MLDTQSFSNILCKILDIFSRFILVFYILTIVILYLACPRIVAVINISVLICSLPFAWLLSHGFGSQSQFLTKNNIRPYYEGNRNQWSVARDQFYSRKKSIYLTNGVYGKFGDNIYALPRVDKDIPFAFVHNSGVVAWIELDHKFPHMVIDSLENKTFLPAFLRKNLPPRQMKLEGDFPDYFKVFYEADNETLTLQILTPDRMANLIDNLRTFSIEIQDNYLRIYVDHAQNSSKNFAKFIEMIDTLDAAFKVNRLDRIL